LAVFDAFLSVYQIMILSLYDTFLCAKIEICEMINRVERRLLSQKILHHHFVLNACEVQRFRRLSCFDTRASTCEGCTRFLPSLAPSTDNPWSVVSAPEIGDIPAVLSVS